MVIFPKDPNKVDKWPQGLGWLTTVGSIFYIISIHLLLIPVITEISGECSGLAVTVSISDSRSGNQIQRFGLHWHQVVSLCKLHELCIVTSQ